MFVFSLQTVTNNYRLKCSVVFHLQIVTHDYVVFGSRLRIVANDSEELVLVSRLGIV